MSSHFAWTFLPYRAAAFLLFFGGCRPDGAPSGVVSAASPEAALAGVEILEAGGNAIDAAVAVQFALGVTEPAMSGLGGQTQILVQQPGEEAFVIAGSSYSPSAMPPGATAEDLRHHRATTVPATVKALDYAWRRFGSGKISWDALLAPAIRFADSGFTVGPFRHKVWQRHQARLAESPSTRALFLRRDGSVPRVGTIFRQPELAQTLRRLAESGADDFYEGSLAREIAADMAAHGGWITLEDLNSVPEPFIMPAIVTSYRGHTVATLPPPGGGWVVLQLLNLLELTDQDELRDETSRVRTVAKALRIGHGSRRQDPLSDLVNFSDEVMERIAKETARRLWTLNEIAVGAGSEMSSNGETTHFSVVDGDGLAVSATASINAYFGARAASPTLGFLYNDYMHEFELGQPAHLFALRPNAMPYSSMSPTIVSRDNRPVLVLGSPGSARIISAVAQVTHRWIDLGESITQSVAAPRIHVVPRDRLYLESEATTTGATRWIAEDGFQIVDPATDLVIGGRNAYYGGVHAIAFENGDWVGAADPRRDGKVRYVGR